MQKRDWIVSRVRKSIWDERKEEKIVIILRVSKNKKSNKMIMRKLERFMFEAG